MRTLLFVIVALFMTAFSAMAQEEQKFTFEEEPGSSTYIYEDHTTTRHLNTIATQWKDLWFGKWSHLKEGGIVPLKGIRRDYTVLVDKKDWLEPVASVNVFDIDGIKASVMCVRQEKGDTRVLGLMRLADADYFLLSLKEDSIKLESAARLLYEYAVSCKREKGKTADFEKIDLVVYLNGVLADNAIRNQMMNDAVKAVNRIAPVDCIGYNPESGSALFMHLAGNFIPLWKDMAINEYLGKKSKGKYTLETIGDADASFKAELRDAFLKKVEKLTK